MTRARRIPAPADTDPSCRRRPGPLDLDSRARRWAPIEPGRFLDMNPGLAVTAAGERWVVFCRYPSPPEPGRGSIWAIRATDDLRPTGTPQLLVEEGIDPRVVAEGDDLLVAFSTLERCADTGRFIGCAMVLARFAQRGGAWAASQAVRLPKAPLGGQVSADAQPGWEKNWVPVPAAEDRLGLIYAHEPWQVLELDLKASAITKAHQAAGVTWDYGTVRGGTPPVRWDEGHLVTFFHASQVVGSRSVYTVGACVFEAHAPFAPVAQTAAPLFVAPYRQGAERYGWRFAGSVVFPGGALRSADGFEILCGIDDGEVAVLTLTEAELRDRLGPVRPPTVAVCRDARGGEATLRLGAAILRPASEAPAEAPMVNLARHLAGEGRCFVDVGAGSGDFAVALAPVFDRVLAFEPSRERHGWLARSIALNDATAVTVRRALPTRADALDGRELADLDLLKIDAPGREAAVLAGAAETLRRCVPPVLVRLTPDRSDAAAVVAALAESGYEARSVMPGWLIGLPPRDRRPMSWLL